MTTCGAEVFVVGAFLNPWRKEKSGECVQNLFKHSNGNGKMQCKKSLELDLSHRFSPSHLQGSDLFEIQKCPGKPRSLEQDSYARLRKSTASWEISCLGGQNQREREKNAWRREGGGALV